MQQTQTLSSESLQSCKLMLLEHNDKLNYQETGLGALKGEAEITQEERIHLDKH